MTIPASRSPRRSDALSRERIVEASIEILDTTGEGGLTVRAVTARLSTGRGAIYHHVTNKDDLLSAAAHGVISRALTEAAGDGVISRALTEAADDGANSRALTEAADDGANSRALTEAADEDDPGRMIRGLALAIFDAFVAHPWVRTQLTREPSQPAVQQIWKGIGMQLHQLGLAGAALSDAGSALVHYVLGASAQYAVGAQSTPGDAARQRYVEALAAQWTQPDDGPLLEALLGEHNDRDQFLAGVDIFLAGIASRPSSSS